ncbi:MAG: hypothetical protein ACO3SP_08885 [Ilumatobacteraceae bacterium]
MSESAEFRDRLPDELVAITHSEDYSFPDNSRRRIPGILYVVLGCAVGATFLVRGDDGPLVNGGLLAGSVFLVIVGAFSISSGWPMSIDEQGALAAAGSAVGFAVGHASAQQVWRGVRSRPTWRVLCYSGEDPPRQRALVLVDAVNGRVVEQLTQDSPEAWSTDAGETQG